jgi:hypothetical protein
VERLQIELDSMDRLNMALAMRKNGRASYAKIGEALGITRQSAWALVRRAMRAYVSENVDDMRRTECERLDTLLMQLWPAVLDGDGKSIERAAHVIKLHADISGATAPARLNVAAIIFTDDVLARMPNELIDAIAAGQDPTAALVDVLSRSRIVPASLPEPVLDLPIETVEPGPSVGFENGIEMAGSLTEWDRPVQVPSRYPGETTEDPFLTRTSMDPYCGPVDAPETPLQPDRKNMSLSTGNDPGFSMEENNE